MNADPAQTQPDLFAQLTQTFERFRFSDEESSGIIDFTEDEAWALARHLKPMVEDLARRHVEAGYDFALKRVRDKFESDGHGDYWWIRDRLDELEIPR